MQSPQQQAQSALGLMEEAILRLLADHPGGLTNADVARLLGIESGEGGEHRNMLAWSLISRLVRSGRVERSSAGRQRLVRLK